MQPPILALNFVLISIPFSLSRIQQGYFDGTDLVRSCLKLSTTTILTILPSFSVVTQKHHQRCVERISQYWLRHLKKKLPLDEPWTSTTSFPWLSLQSLTQTALLSIILLLPLAWHPIPPQGALRVHSQHMMSYDVSQCSWRIRGG